MPRGNFAAQMPRNYPHRGGYFERGEKLPLLWGRDNLGRHLRDNLDEGNFASQKMPRDSGESIFAARHQDVSQGPLGNRNEGTFGCSPVQKKPGTRVHENVPRYQKPQGGYIRQNRPFTKPPFISSRFESPTENWHFHSLEPYTKPCSNIS